MQKNREIGKIQRGCPILVGRIVHRFIRDLTASSAAVSQDLGKTGNCLNYKLSREHVRYTIDNN